MVEWWKLNDIEWLVWVFVFFLEQSFLNIWIPIQQIWSAFKQKFLKYIHEWVSQGEHEDLKA